TSPPRTLNRRLLFSSLHWPARPSATFPPYIRMDSKHNMLDRLRLGTIGRIVSQVNIEEIRKDVEQPFHLLIVATENDAANNLACLLSDLAGNFVHPWLTTTAPPVALPARGQDPIDLAILLSHAVDLP